MRNDSDDDVFELARRNDAEGMREAILNRNRSASVYERGRQPLHVACVAGNTAVARAMLELGVDPNSPQQACLPPDRPVQLAVRYGDLELVRLLVTHGADLNKCLEGMMPLQIAARLDRVEIASFLIKNGARPNEPGDPIFGCYPLHEARSREMATLLLESGASTHLRCADELSALGHAKFAQRNDVIGVLKTAVDCEVGD